MAKQIAAKVKLQCKGGQATPSPPVGPALGQHGVNIMEFCKAFNAQTKGKEGMVIPVIITIYSDRSFTFIMKSPPAAVLLKQAVAIAKGSSEPNKNFVGEIKKEKIKEIVEIKKADLNAVDEDGAMKIIEGTARSMGIKVV